MQPKLEPRTKSRPDAELACSLAAVAAVFSLVVGGCCPRRPPETPFGSTSRGAAILATGLDPVRAREVLAQAPPRQVQELRQLMFIADLQMARGNEHDPERLLARVQRELAEPLVIDQNTAAGIADALARVVRALPRAADGTAILTAEQGWSLVGRALEPLLGGLPSTGDCLARIMTYPPDLAVAFLGQELFADHHYHQYNMGAAILRALATGGAGARALPVYAEAVRRNRDSTWSAVFSAAVDGARGVLGSDFDAWYWGVQGRAYCRDER